MIAVAKAYQDADSSHSRTSRLRIETDFAGTTASGATRMVAEPGGFEGQQMLFTVREYRIEFVRSKNEIIYR